MAQDGFKHIIVTQADDEDEVISAGIKRSEQTGSSLEPVDVHDEPPHSPEGDPAAREDDAPRASARPLEVNEPLKAPHADAYRETTLEDLKGEPMSLTQRIVIIAAVVCIIGAIIYYVAFMR